MKNKNKLICGDNLVELAKIKEESIDLIYIDPPFFSNKNYEVVWKDEAEVRSFKDRWKGGINNYIEWMEERVIELHRVLKPTGSMYLHCDWHASHYLKVMMDKIFGKKKFRNEIIWHYNRWTAVSGMFQRMHDNIYFYTKSGKYTFNKLFKEYSKASKKAHKQRGFIQRGHFKSYPNPKGVSADDVWEINFPARSKERLGYPTQKPEALLEKIIKASSNKGDLVLDAFAGCGTALAVAQKLGRQWIGIDISPTAIKVMGKRLEKLGASDIKITGLPTSLKQLKKLEPFEFQNWVVSKMEAYPSRKKTGDMGIDGYIKRTLFKEPAVIQVKQSEKVGRNVVDNFETAIRRAKKKNGFIVAFSFGKGAYEEAARARKDDLNIKLITIKHLKKMGKDFDK